MFVFEGHIDFADDRSDRMLTATVRRDAAPATGSVESSVEHIPGSVEDADDDLHARARARILAHLADHSTDTISTLAVALGLSTRAIEKQIATLHRQGRLSRIGPKKGGRWEVVR